MTITIMENQKILDFDHPYSTIVNPASLDVGSVLPGFSEILFTEFPINQITLFKDFIDDSMEDRHKALESNRSFIANIRGWFTQVSYTTSYTSVDYIYNLFLKDSISEKANLDSILTGIVQLAASSDRRDKIAIPPLGHEVGDFTWEEFLQKATKILDEYDHLEWFIFKAPQT